MLTPDMDTEYRVVLDEMRSIAGETRLAPLRAGGHLLETIYNLKVPR